MKFYYKLLEIVGVCVSVWGGGSICGRKCEWKHLLHTKTDIGSMTFGSPEGSVL